MESSLEEEGTEGSSVTLSYAGLWTDLPRWMSHLYHTNTPIAHREEEKQILLHLELIGRFWKMIVHRKISERGKHS